MNIPILGYSQMKFGEFWDISLKELIIKSIKDIIKNSNLKIEDIDCCYIANCFSGIANGQTDLKSFAAELGINKVVQISGGDSCGSEAIQLASKSILSKKDNICLAMGVEKISDLKSSQKEKVVSTLLDQELESFNGATMVSMYALIAKRYMEEFKIHKKDLAKIAIKAHKFGKSNEFALYKNQISEEDVIKSQLIADPIHMLNCSSYMDGVCSIILGNDKSNIALVGTGSYSDYLALQERASLIEFKATKEAVKQALLEANINLSDIKKAEVHDVFSISELLAMEDLGFCGKGRALEFIDKLNINLSGGLKANGHAFAATGIRQAIDTIKRLENNEFGLTHTLSGVGSSAFVNIFHKKNFVTNSHKNA